MCGIWGILSKKADTMLQKKDQDIAETMSLISTQRGRHSTGFCYTPRIFKQAPTFPEPHVIKCVGSPFSIWHSTEGQAALQRGFNFGNSVFGHNRYATKGSISTKNAHPFQEGNWTLVHNGTLWGGVTLSDGVEVDSHALCKRIDEVGIKEALMTIDGAFAVIAYSQKDGNIFIARNGQRPLAHFTFDGKVYIMSDKLDLRYALEKHDRYRLIKEQGDTGKIEDFKEHVLYQMTEDGLKEVDTVHPRVVVTTTTYTNYGGSSQHHGYQTSTTPPPRFTNPTIPRISKANQEFLFQINAIIKNSEVQYRYECTATEGQRVFFFTNQEKPELLGKYGLATSRALHFDVKANKQEWQVKFKEIVFDEDDDLKSVFLAKRPLSNAAPPLGSLEACAECADPLYILSAATVTADGKKICADCVDAWEKYGNAYLGSTRRENMT